MESKSKTHNSDSTVINKIRDGTEWSPSKPGQPAKNRQPVIQPARSVVQVIEDILIHWFMTENPRADDAVIVENSLRLIDPVRNTWRAKVQTFVYFPTIEPRIHESNVKFDVISRVDKKNPSLTHYAIYNNHVKFPQ